MSMTRTIVLSSTLAALALNVASAADEYQWEVGLGFAQTTEDSTPDLKATTVLATGEYHFAPVKLGDHPWEEAAFLEHSTFVNAGLGYVTVKQDSSGGFDAKGPIFGVGFTYATPEFPVRLRALLITSKVEDSDQNVDVKTTSIELDAGYWILPELIAGLKLVSSKTTTTSATDDKELDITAYGKWVRAINGDLAFNAEAELGRNAYDSGSKDSNTVLGVSGDIYYQQQYGVGLALGTEAGDAKGAEGVTIGVRASAWFTENFGARLGYEMFTAKDDKVGSDDSTVSLELVGRF